MKKSTLLLASSLGFLLMAGGLKGSSRGTKTAWDYLSDNFRNLQSNAEFIKNAKLSSDKNRFIVPGNILERVARRRKKTPQNRIEENSEHFGWLLTGEGPHLSDIIYGEAQTLMQDSIIKIQQALTQMNTLLNRSPRDADVGVLTRERNSLNGIAELFRLNPVLRAVFGDYADSWIEHIASAVETLAAAFNHIIRIRPTGTTSVSDLRPYSSTPRPRGPLSVPTISTTAAPMAMPTQTPHRTSTIATEKEPWNLISKGRPVEPTMSTTSDLVKNTLQNPRQFGIKKGLISGVWRPVDNPLEFLSSIVDRTAQNIARLGQIKRTSSEKTYLEDTGLEFMDFIREINSNLTQIDGLLFRAIDLQPVLSSGNSLEIMLNTLERISVTLKKTKSLIFGFARYTRTEDLLEIKSKNLANLKGFQSNATIQTVLGHDLFNKIVRLLQDSTTTMIYIGGLYGL